MKYVDEAQPVTDELVALAAPVTPPEVFRFAVLNAGCVHFQSDYCTLVSRVVKVLPQFNLAHNTDLSVLAVEMMPRYDQYIYKGKAASGSIRPLSAELGQYRILRTSPLVAVPEICCEECV